MLNIEEVLIKIIHVIDINMKDIGLKQTLQKERFITHEESNQKYKEHINSIFDALELDKTNKELRKIFEELIFLYLSIRSDIVPNSHQDNEKKINWILLKRLVIPYLAFSFANLDIDYDQRIDKNMPGGVFWYLPDIDDLNDIKMPIQFLMDWLLDLYGRGLDSLCNEIDEESLVDQAYSSINTLKPWKYHGILPDKDTLELYLNKDLEYTGVFEPKNEKDINKTFHDAIFFVKEKKSLSIEELKKEIPYHGLVDQVFNKQSNLRDDDKKVFIDLIKDRWSRPEKNDLINKFLIARGVQGLYRGLKKYFGFKASNDLESNKILQLIHLYKFLYNSQMEFMKRSSINHLYYEFVEPFKLSINETISTIGGDITIELTNPNVEKWTLEDIYLLKVYVFLEFKDERIEKAIKETEVFNEYFHKNFNDIDSKVKNYQSLHSEIFSEELKTEKSFQVLMNLYRLNSHDYCKAEKICFQMSNIAKGINEEFQAKMSFLALYSNVHISENKFMYSKTKELLDWIDSDASIDNLIEHEQNKKEVILAHAFFYLKSKDFDISLDYFDNYFKLYVLKKKKENIMNLAVNLAAYCAYTIKDNKKLKQYNRYLRTQNLKVFETKQSLHLLPIFYK